MHWTWYQQMTALIELDTAHAHKEMNKASVSDTLGHGHCEVIYDVKMPADIQRLPIEQYHPDRFYL